MSVTQRDIATKLGVSQYVVSHALRNAGRISSQTRQRVLRAAAELHYRPNSAARAVRVGRLGNVTLLNSTAAGRSTLDPTVLMGIDAVLVREGISLQVAYAPDEKLVDAGVLPRLIEEQTCDGLIINYTDHFPAAFAELVAQLDVPTLWINVKRDSDCVYPDDRQGGRLATQVLIDRGFRNIAYADFSHARNEADAHYSSADREAGYRDAMDAAGLPGDVLRRSEKFASRQRPAYALRWLMTRPEIEAVVCYSEGTAIPLAMADLLLEPRRPRRVHLAAIGSKSNRLIGYELCAAHLSGNALGRAVADALLSKMKTPDRAMPPVAVPYEHLDDDGVPDARDARSTSGDGAGEQ